MKCSYCEKPYEQWEWDVEVKTREGMHFSFCSPDCAWKRVPNGSDVMYFMAKPRGTRW